MAKIIKFKTKTEDTIDFLESVKQEVINQNIDNMLVACKCPDGSILTGYTKNLDWGTKMELHSHIQVDTINDMIKTNYMNND